MNEYKSPETWRWCRDCAELTGGHCWRHLSWTYVIPVVAIPTTVTVIPAIVVPQQLGDSYAER